MGAPRNFSGDCLEAGISDQPSFATNSDNLLVRELCQKVMTEIVKMKIVNDVLTHLPSLALLIVLGVVILRVAVLPLLKFATTNTRMTDIMGIE